MEDWRAALVAKQAPTVWPHIDVEDGWRPLVECFYAWALERGDIQIDQIKEKFGGLRLYWSWTNPDEEILWDEAESRAAYAFTDALQAASTLICERCGDYGHTRWRAPDGESYRWVKTLCDTCEAKVWEGSKWDR